MSSILKVDTIQDQSGNNIINENADTITIGASGDTINVVGTLQNNGAAFAQGITEADQWRVTTGFALTGGSEIDITTNLERVDTAGQGYIGTGMSESSGIFTFPSTGVYLVKFAANAEQNGDNRYVQTKIYITIDNSSYGLVATSGQFIQQTSSSDGSSYREASTLVDVTDTANVKAKFAMLSAASTPTVNGSSTQNATYITFIRLGDT